VRFDSRDYYRASHERIRQAWTLYNRFDGDDANLHPLALYTAGVAVECMLRAFITRRSREFDSRHDLRDLFIESGILDIKPDSKAYARMGELELQRLKQQLGSAVGYLSRVWNNAYRYASESQLRSHLFELRLAEEIKGDPLIEILWRMLHASQLIIDRETVLWEI
jgi:HEPN domain-containing protein